MELTMLLPHNSRMIRVVEKALEEGRAKVLAAMRNVDIDEKIYNELDELERSPLMNAMHELVQCEKKIDMKKRDSTREMNNPKRVRQTQDALEQLEKTRKALDLQVVDALCEPEGNASEEWKKRHDRELSIVLTAIKDYAYAISN